MEARTRRMSMTSERREIEKYIKFFCLKSLQVVLHSRSGEKSRTTSRSDAVGIDWFNLAIPDTYNGEVHAQMKKIVGKKVPALSQPICVDIYLKTAENQCSLLETWFLEVTEKRDSSVKSCFTVYSRLIVLLKSVLIVSRTLPAYRLTRRKQDDFSFFYRIYEGSPSAQMLDLQEPSKICKFGSVGTEFGTITYSVWYRTKIFIETQSNKLIIDLFNNEQVTPIRKIQNLVRGEDKKDGIAKAGQEIVEELAKAALDDISSSNISLPRSFQPGSSPDFDPGTIWVTKDKNNDAIIETEFIPSLPSVGNINDDFRPMAAFAESSLEGMLSSVPELPSTPPLLSFIQEKIDQSIMISLCDDRMQEVDFEKKSNNVLSENLEQALTTPKDFESLDFIDGNGEPTAQAVGFEDDFVLVEVRPAFAPSVGDVGTLYRECQNPPMLDMFDQDKSNIDNDLTFAEKLKLFENELVEFDGFFRNLEHLKVS